MPISCVYCGGTHADGAGVRACWQEHGEPLERSSPELDATQLDATQPDAAAVTAADDQLVLAPDRTAVVGDVSAAPSPRRRAERVATASPVASRRSDRAPVELGAVEGLAGPEVLGRGLVVRRGGPVAPPWSHAPRVVVDAAALSRVDELVVRLRAIVGRRVIEIDVDDEVVDALDAIVERRALHELGAEHVLHGDEVAHLVFDHSVDARDPARPRWVPLEQAIRLGGRRPIGDERGDLVAPDGAPRWIDGGPLRHRTPIDGIAVVPRLAVQHGSLHPFGANERLFGALALAPDQLAAVVHDGGAARVIAPAGSGKTRVLTERARHLVDVWGLPGSAITLVAFNKRAQDEMQSRLGSSGAGVQPQVRTLNAIALAIVNGAAPFAPRPRRLRTIDEADVRRIIGRMVKFPRRRNADPVAPWIEALGLVRLGLRPPEQVEAMYDGDVDGFASTYPAYRAALDRDGIVDFDEQIHLAIELLLADPVARARAQLACRVLLVDEFQDLAPAHLLLVRLLAGPDGAVFGVGDDDQTIYGYNGADPAWLIDFHRLFPTAGEHPLEVNYRCPGDVVELVDRLLRHNRRRVPKTIRSAHPDRSGLSVVEAGAATVSATVEAVSAALVAGRRPSEIAVLARVNSTLAPVQIALGEAAIAVSGGVGVEFLDRTGVRSTLAWLRLALDRWSPVDLAEALRRPSRSMHPNVAKWVAEQTSILGLQRLAARVNNERDAMRVGEFAADIERLRAAAGSGATTGDLLVALHTSIGLAGAVASLDASRHGMNRTSQHDDLLALTQIAGLQPDPAAFEPWLRERLGRRRSPGGVVLATVHRVKGQEWPMVVVHQADADLFPHGLADDVEEERRLFHVALTRAIDQVVVVAGAEPSPFVAELRREPAPFDPHQAGRAGDARSRADRSNVDPASLDRSSNRRGPAARPTSPAPADPVLFERLRTLRRELAQGKPAYVVFDDATLRTIADARPSTLRELAAIRGVGPAKLEQYGQAFLDALAET